jgi:hypothetical protein
MDESPTQRRRVEDEGLWTVNSNNGGGRCEVGSGIIVMCEV